MKCNICGIETNSLFNGKCMECYGKYNIYPITTQIEFNYECPTCKGRFNYPAYSSYPGTIRSAYCPFCGYQMVGLSQ